MSQGKSIAGAARHITTICFAALVFAIVPLSGDIAAQPTKSTAATEAETTPAKVHELLTLLADPKVQAWLKKEVRAEAASASAQESAEVSVSHMVDTQLGAIRAHIVALVAAAPDLPNQIERGSRLATAELGDGGRIRALLLLVIFATLGFGVEWLFRKATKRARERLEGHPMETVRERLHLIALRLAFIAGGLLAFALGSVGAFLAFDWPPVLREMVSGYLAAILATRVAVVVSRFLLAPTAESFRIIPVDTVAARFWFLRAVAFVGWFAFGWVMVGLGGIFGWSTEARQLVAYAFGLVLLAIALEAVWRRPARPEDAAEPLLSLKHHRFGHRARNVLLSIGIVLLWVLWVAHAMASFWLVLVAITLPLAIIVTRRAVEHLLRPPGSGEAAEAPSSVFTVCLERGLRALLIIGAAAVLGWGWGMDMDSLTGRDTMIGRIAHGVLSAVVILLVADLLWHAIKAAIDRKLAQSAELGLPNTDEARRQARLRTLLPIFRNVLFVVVIAIAVLMALAALGVEIGPLIAGLSVVGVAIGFGAQTFVRDVIAGMFYLMDDAFRVGEYIQSGNYKGTVEGFSIRSVKLRHHRGPVYTVPFSLLGAVQNQSRDWVIDKMMVGITYDSDIERARKLIKQIGLDLQKDEEFAPLILEPLKMQGVEQFGDFAVQIRMKMMTLPGEQFVIRRKAYAMIKKAFDENGIKFAFPTVSVAGEGEPSTAAIAQRGLELTHPVVAAAE
jgi:moderate conductance mechanosensitive channel